MSVWSLKGAPGLPQVVVDLAVTTEGIPVSIWVLPGNTVDAATVEKFHKDLREWNIGRVHFIADAGKNSEDNCSEL